MSQLSGDIKKTEGIFRLSWQQVDHLAIKITWGAKYRNDVSTSVPPNIP